MTPARLGRLLTQALLLPVVLLLCLAAVLLAEVQATLRASHYEQLSDRTISDIQSLLKLLIDQETGLRGYQVTRDPQFLEPYRNAAPEFDRRLHDLNQRITGQSAQEQDLAEVTAQYHAWHEYAERVRTMVASGADSHDLALNLEGKRRMDDLRDRLADMTARAAGLRDQRSSHLQQQAQRIVNTTLALAVILGLALGLWARSRLHTVSQSYADLLRAAQQKADELYTSRQNYLTTLQSIGDAVITCDPDGSVQFMNKVAEDLCGITFAQAENRPLLEVFNIVNETTREIVENPVDKVRRLNAVVGLANHTVLLRPDGSEINIDDSGAPIRDQNGRIIGIVMVFRDITQERRTEQALLANEKLAVAGRLSATIAHEIHNPLDSVANLLYLLQADPSPQDRARFLNLATQELSRVTNISRTLLSLYREPKAPVQIDLKDLLESVAVLMDRKMLDARVTLTQQLPDRIRVQGYPAELRQVFTNLLANAMEAAGENGRVTIRLRAAEEDAENRGAIVEIEDDGPGIAPDVQPRLFAPFFTTKGEQGTGLGLWVSRGIVTKHNGIIEVVSQVGPGHHTIMRVYLPETFRESPEAVTA